MKKVDHLSIDIQEANLDFSTDSWKEVVKNDFQAIRNALEKNPNSLSPAYYTWFLFFLKYGKAICSEEGKKYIKDKNTNVFNLVRDAIGLQMSSGGAYTVGYKFYDECIKNAKAIEAAGITIEKRNNKLCDVPKTAGSQLSYLRAMRTKPFLLLAGISGTGKSRIVKQMAFDSCPEVGDLRKDPTSPGNYCLIEVKPNWHDSTELLGYESKIGGAHYQLTTFVKFLAKAMLYPEVPFFLCLDEMNLAPVEQYFAEFLSVLESRSKVGKHIISEPLIKADIFANSEYESQLKDDLFGLRLRRAQSEGLEIIDGELNEDEQRVYDILCEKGLRIPENLVVIGTVNMDETTHQFSRKVIDRAMTIEMNLPEGDPFMDFFENSSKLEYHEEPSSPSLYLSTEVRAADVIDILTSENAEETEALKHKVATFLKGLNDALDKTPFQVAYRVQNELVLYFYQLWLEDKSANWSEILTNACDQILMMKVLPRIEGDEELLEKPLARLSSFCQPFPNASKKLTFMTGRLAQSRFASFWP